MKRFTGALVAGGLLVAALPAAAQSTIRPGDTVRGSLSASDRTFDDGSHYDCFNLRARAGERISVTLRSNDFDAYLSVLEANNCPNSAAAETDDDSAGGTDSRVQMTLGSGRYSIRANSLSEGETGDYTLAVEYLPAARAPEATYLGRASTHRFGDLTYDDAMAADDSFYDCYAFDVRSGQTAGIGLTSEDFDAYLSLHEGGSCGLEIESDDDGLGDGTDAYIEHVFDRGGRYSIRANSLNSGETGHYGLVIEIQ
ncbi:MAG TPA: peptidase [Brevundimonas sp.]|nr:peptidase [Brevundimonas sp.]